MILLTPSKGAVFARCEDEAREIAAESQRTVIFIHNDRMYVVRGADATHVYSPDEAN